MRTPSCVLVLSLVLIPAALSHARPGLPEDRQPARTGAVGDPLPEGALARFGTARFRVLTDIQDAALSPDAKLLAVMGSDEICLIDAKTGKKVRRLQGERGDYAAWGRLKFSPNGRFLAISEQHSVLVYDVARGVLVGGPKGDRVPPPSTVSFSADGKLLAVAGKDVHGNGFLVLRNPSTQRQVKKLTVSNKVIAAVLSPDGKTVAVQEDRETESVLHLLETASGKKRHTLTFANILIQGVAFSPDGKRLVVIEKGTSLSIHDITTGKQIRRCAVRRGTGAVVAWSADGKRLATSTLDGVVQIWDSGTGHRLAQSPPSPHTRIVSILFIPDNKVLVAGVCRQMISICEVPSGRQRTPRSGHVAAVSQLVFSQDGKTLWSSGKDGVRSWQTATGKELRHVEARRTKWLDQPGDPDYILSPTGRYFVWSGRYDVGLRAVETASGEEIAELDGYLGLDCTFAADGRTLAVLGVVRVDEARQFVARVWNLQTGVQTGQIDLPFSSQGSRTLTLSPNARVLAVVTTPEPVEKDQSPGRLLDLAGGKEIVRLSSVSGYGRVTFSPDGSLVAATTGKEEICLYDAITGKEIQKLPAIADRWAGMLAFSPDGRTLASIHYANQKREVRLWELVSGKIRAQFLGHEGGATSMAFSPDGRTLATGSSDTTVLLWDVTGRGTRPADKLKPADLVRLWKDLDGDDAGKAHQAMGQLIATPADALALLKKELQPAPGKPPEEKEVKRLVSDLGDDSFEVREKASKALAQAGTAVRPALIAALKVSPDLEKKRRLEELIRSLSPGGPDPQHARASRAMEVLERLDTEEARHLLRSLARGNPGARLTLDAIATLKRLRRKP